MNLGMFYRSVRFVVSAAALLACAPALAMNVSLGQYVELRSTKVTFKVVGAKILDQDQVTLELLNTATGQSFELTVQDQANLADVPELAPPPVFRSSRALPLLN